MKGRASFTPSEITKLRRLIKEKQVADRARQTGPDAWPCATRAKPAVQCGRQRGALEGDLPRRNASQKGSTSSWSPPGGRTFSTARSQSAGLTRSPFCRAKFALEAVEQVEEAVALPSPVAPANSRLPKYARLLEAEDREPGPLLAAAE